MSKKLQKNIKEAEKAKKYALLRIDNIPTRLSNNLKEEHVRRSLIRNILSLRRQNNRLKQNKDFRYQLELDVELAVQHRIANCSELAKLALHYFILNTKDVHAEIYHIQNGDHVYFCDRT